MENEYSNNDMESLENEISSLKEEIRILNVLNQELVDALEELIDSVFYKSTELSDIATNTKRKL